MNSGLRALLATLFVLALPLALVLTNIRILAFDPAYYQWGYDQNQVGQWTGMSDAQLAEATRQVQAYFRGGPPVALVVQKEWGPENLFNQREMQHLADVRDLLGTAMRVQELSLAYLAVVAAFLLVGRRPDGARTLARWAAIASGATLGLFAVVGLLAMGDFESFWRQFHVLSFNNGLWLLDWRTDYMIRLWPQPFWFDAVLRVVLRSAIGAGAILLAAQIYLWRRGVRRPAPAPVAPAA